MSRLEYPLTIWPLDAEESGGYLVEFPDLPGCMSDGEEAVRDWVAAMKEAGRPIPPPSHSERYSGKWQMRVPRSLHRRLVDRTKAEGVSLNTLAINLMAGGIGERSVAKRKRA